MKKCLSSVTLAAVACGACLAVPVVEENLVRNPGFEMPGQNGLPAEWQGTAAGYSRDEAVKHSGAASLKFVNHDASRYVVCVQRELMEPGLRYELSAWIKTENIVGKGGGATIALEWSDDRGNYLGNCVVGHFKGTTDWRQVKAISIRVPEKATRRRVTIFVDREMTGTAWWDDISVVRYRIPLTSVVRVPRYRGLVTDLVTQAQVRACLDLTNLEDCSLKAVELRWSLCKDGEEPAVRTGKAAVAAASVDLEIPVSGLSAGEYELTVNLVALKTGQTLGVTRHRLMRPAPGQVCKVLTDEHQRLLVDGKPFFPLGMYLYWGMLDEADIADYMDSGIFNCLAPWGMPTPDGLPSKEHMDLAQAKGLKVIYPLGNTYFGEQDCERQIQSEADERPFIEKKVTAFRDHPALLVWYLNDEKPLKMLPRLVAHQRWLEELDPNHATFANLCNPDEIRPLIESYDVISADPYPITLWPVSTVGDWTRLAVEGVAASRPVWMVPQVFNYICYHPNKTRGSRPPTFDEMRCMAWQCIAEGATGLIFYQLGDLKRDKDFPFAQQWPKVKKMAEEIRDMIPALLSVERPPAIEVKQDVWLRSLVKQLNG